MAARKSMNFDLINVFFNDKEKAEYGLWLEQTNRDLLDLLQDLQENGMKVSVSSNGAEATPLITITVKRKRGNKDGRCFMYRHVDLEKALRIAYYHFTVVTNYGEAVNSDDSKIDW